MLGLASFLQRLLAFVVHSMPFGSSMFGTTKKVLFDDIVRNWKDSTVLLVQLLGPLRGFRLLPHQQYTMPISQFQHNRGIVSWKKFRKARRSPYCPCRWSPSSTIREHINLFNIIQVLQVKLLDRVILELLNQLLDCFSAIRVLLLDCRLKYAWYSVVDVAAAGFTVTSRYALVVWGFSCFLIRLILLSTLRIRLQYN